jgi:CBS domain-containing protein
MAGTITVRDAMTKDIKVVREDTNMQEVVATMLKFDISSIVVVQKERPIGLVTHEDVLARIMQQDLLPSALTARQVMSTPVSTIGEEASIEEAAQVMARKKIKKLVVTKQGNLVGIITSMDIVREEPKLVAILEELLKPCIKK